MPEYIYRAFEILVDDNGKEQIKDSPSIEYVIDAAVPEIATKIGNERFFKDINININDYFTDSSLK